MTRFKSFIHNNEKYYFRILKNFRRRSYIDEADFKVNFVVAGTQKGGTTALDSYLRRHKCISMALKKEVHYFDNDLNFSGKPDYSIYHTYFWPGDIKKLHGESTPIYMYWHDAPARMCQYNPELKIIIVLRNPVDRAFSHWNMERGRGREKLSFWDAILKEQERCRGALPFQHRVFSYIDRGFYTEQLKRIWNFFPRNQTLILRNEDLNKSLQDTLRHVSGFLGIDDFGDIEAETVHARPYVSKMTVQERDQLNRIFYCEIKELEKILGWDCSGWVK